MPLTAAPGAGEAGGVDRVGAGQRARRSSVGPGAEADGGHEAALDGRADAGRAGGSPGRGRRRATPSRAASRAVGRRRGAQRVDVACRGVEVGHERLVGRDDHLVGQRLEHLGWRPHRSAPPARRCRRRAGAASDGEGEREATARMPTRSQPLQEGEQVGPLVGVERRGSASRAASASPPCQRIASSRLRARPSCRKRVWPLTVSTRPMPHSGGVRHSAAGRPRRRAGRRPGPAPMSWSSRSV